MDVPPSRWLEHSAASFDAVEINNSFYRLPERRTFLAWASRVPRCFEFAVKASRFLTHMKKLKDPEEPFERLFSRLRGLGRHLGPVLYQLPPGRRVDVDRFRPFVRALPRGPRHVVEFREPTWYCPQIRDAMERHGVAMCVDMPGSATGHLRTGPFVYVRFHGTAGRYGGSYSHERLRRWSEWLRAQRDAGCDVYAYFNNDVGGHAPRNARTLQRLVAAAEGLGI